MKLFYAPGTCALAVHVLLAELDVSYSTESVDLMLRRTASGLPLDQLNPKGKVPFVVTDEGEVMTEATVILCRLADTAGRFAPARQTRQYWQMCEWLSYLSNELHGLFGQLLTPGTPAESVAIARTLLARKLAFIESELQSDQGLVGQSVTVADFYLYVMLCWAKLVQLPLGPRLSALHGMLERRPAVRRALHEQGLLN